MVGIRRVQRDGPLLIIGNHPVCERPVGLTLHQPRQSRNTEKIASLRPQRQARQQAGQGGTPIAHGRADLDRVCVRLESVDRGHLHLAPVAHRTDDGSPGAAFEDLDVLESIGPGRPIIGNEVRENDTVATDLAVHHGSHVHNRTARHPIRNRRSHRQRERQPLVDDRDVAGRPGLAVRDGGGAHHHLNGRAGDWRQRQQKQPGRQRKFRRGHDFLAIACATRSDYRTAARYKRRNSSAALCRFCCQSSAAA